MRSVRASLVLALLLLTAAAGGQAFEKVHQFGQRQPLPTDRLTVASDGTVYGVNAGDTYGFGSIYRLLPDGSGGYAYEQLYAFRLSDGSQPTRLVEVGTKLYGTTMRGGPHDLGTFFVFEPSTGGLRVLHYFDQPAGPVAAGPDGALYGISTRGGSGDLGTLFRLTSAGEYTLLHEFAGLEGSRPTGGLLLASDGHLYGVASHGGIGWNGDPNSGYGSIFRADVSGAVTSIYPFAPSEAREPNGDLIEGSGGLLYGTARYGGAHDEGTVYRTDLNGSLFVIHSFQGSATEGRAPLGGLAQEAGGAFLGAATSGGPDDRGVVFRITSDGAIETAAAFPNEGPQSLRFPTFALAPTPSGDVLGIAQYGGPSDVGGIFRLTSPQGYEVVHQLARPAQPLNPSSELIEAADGTLWGGSGGGAFGRGAVFRIVKEEGDLDVVHDFDFPDGGDPRNFLLASDGLVYGTTRAFGTYGSGTIFSIDETDTLTTLHAIDGGFDGAEPTQLLEAADGNLYGTMYASGANSLGTLFRMTKAGDFTKLFDFVDPGFPRGLVQASDGNLYGTTEFGGDSFAGTLFRSDLTGPPTFIHSFSIAEGAFPYAGPIQASDGRLYGTTFTWGPGGWGAVWGSALDGDATTIHAFGDNPTGLSPGRVAEAGDGYLYGVTNSQFGGDGGVFRVDKSGGNFSMAHQFALFDGSQPAAGPFVASDGDVYGATPYGGWYFSGLVYRLDLSNSAPTIETVTPTSGHADGGVNVTIRGRHLRDGASLDAGGVPFLLPADYDMRTLFALSPPLTPGTLNDVTLTNADGQPGTLPAAFFADFLDVPGDSLFHAYVETLVRLGITAGCGGGAYCPLASVTRAQMAVFLLKAEHGSGYVPPPCGGVFADVPCPSLFADWIEQLAAEGIAAGCGGGNYCPDAAVRRDQMAALLLRTKHGSGYAPPPCAGVFPDVPCPSLFADWIEELLAEGVTAGCGGGLYCPHADNTREQMAAFLVRTFAP